MGGRRFAQRLRRIFHACGCREDLDTPGGPEGRGMHLRRAVGQVGIALALCMMGLLVPVAGASAAKSRTSAPVSYRPIGAPVNTLVVRNPNGLRAIQIGSSYYDTNYVADELVLHRSDLTPVANSLLGWARGRREGAERRAASVGL